MPTAIGVATIVTVAIASPAIEPSSQTTRLPLVVNVPCEGATETSAAVAGKRLVTTTPAAEDGPMLVTVIV